MKGDDHWEKIILMVFFCFSLSAISVADAGQKQHDETKVSQQIFDRFMHQLFSKEILENVRGYYKDNTMSVTIQNGVELSEDSKGDYIIKFTVLPHSKRSKMSETDTITFRVNPFILATDKKESAITFLNLHHNDPTKQSR
ncbi:hypothetical protein P4U97_17830 [Bacillus swezeyi]|uniref:hypothetical protein n=1 Tax=Bacillus swezeyi TaxID=1925020 RepID=UPI0027DCDE8B|nr:hypothetical protein [Bacillus swezeyi]MED1741339.1 hypothetical protein [Bacillus swezeyi]